MPPDDLVAATQAAAASMDPDDVAVAVGVAMRLHLIPPDRRVDPRLRRLYRIMADVACVQRRLPASLALGRAWACIATGDEPGAMDGLLEALETYCATISLPTAHTSGAPVDREGEPEADG